MPLTAIPGKVLLKMLEEPKSESGIEIAQAKYDEPISRGTLMVRDPLDTNNDIPEGTQILFPTHSAAAIKDGDDTIYTLDSSQILAVVE